MKDKDDEKPAIRDVLDLDGLQRAGDELPSFFDLSMDMMCIAGLDGYLKAVNRTWEKTLGFTCEELCAKPYLEFVHQNDRESTIETVRKLFKDGGAVPAFVNRYLCRDGSYRWLSWNFHPITEKGLFYAVVHDITEHRQMEELLRASEYLRVVFHNVYEALFIHDMDGTMIQVNNKMLEMYQVDASEVLKMSIRNDLSGPDNDLDRLDNYWKKVLDGENQFFEWQACRPGDGSVFDVEVFLCKFTLEGGDRILAAVRDVTERKRTQRELQTVNEELKKTNEELDATNEELAAANQELIAMNEELTVTEEELRQQVGELELNKEALDQANQELLDIIDFLPDATFVIDRNGRIIAWNKAVEKMTGRPKEDMIGQGGYAHAMAFYGECRPMLVDAIVSEQPDIENKYELFQRKGDNLYGEVFIPTLFDGRGACIRSKASPLYDRRGNTTGAIESIRDITDQKRFEGELRYLSLHDPLTGLYNRNYFEQEVMRLRHSGQQSLGIILADVDGLKLVNDGMGHDTGNRLLVAAAQVIKSSFRKTDMVSRVGGDEFAVLLPGYDKDAVEEVADRIRKAVQRYNFANPTLPLSISVGFAVSSEKPVNVTEMFKVADNNMYREKLHRSRSTRSATVQTLMKALEARDFITQGHADRLQTLVASVAEELGLSQRDVSDLRLLAQFHDIGKVGIPDSILFKPGPLDAEETREMQRHCEIGHRIALSAPDLHPIAEWILQHHEWWNGQGYPQGLKGEEIPLECRILAIADAYDAMTSDRPYRKALSHGDAVNELKRCAGTQFDPELTGRFILILENGRLYT